MKSHPKPNSKPAVDRREWLSYAAFGSAAIAAGSSQASTIATAASFTQSQPKYQFKKSINLWAFPYPDKMSLKECLQLAK
ncbi:MAG: sugar phosphate isomerase/epimerase, partial [Rhodopirellula bahusiensis]